MKIALSYTPNGGSSFPTTSEFKSISNRGIFLQRIGIHLQQIIRNTLCTKIRGKKRNRTTITAPL